MLQEIPTEGYERVVYCENKETGLQSIVAIHNTNRGPACGGLRLLPYTSREEALKDVLRLSKGMSYKSALAGIGFGGGKSVIILDPKKKNPNLFRTFGDFVNSFSGRYITAKDMNVEGPDLAEIKKITSHVLGIEGEPGSGGDPSPVTARGLFAALRATWEAVSGTSSLKGVTVAIQGLGHVGYDYARLIHNAGGKLIVTDLNQEPMERAKKEFGAILVKNTEIFSVECDVLAPCAVGAVLNSKTIPQLKCKAICGGANNQLEKESDGKALHDRGIIYAPDYAANSGGIINVYIEHRGYDREKALKKADEIYNTMKEIFLRSKRSNTPTSVVADQLAEERLYGKH